MAYIAPAEEQKKPRLLTRPKVKHSRTAARRRLEASDLINALPEIDYEEAKAKLHNDDHEPLKGWPENWQWLVVIHDAAAEIEKAEKRSLELRRSLSSFREFYERGDLWIGLGRVRFPAIKGGWIERVVNVPAKPDTSG